MFCEYRPYSFYITNIGLTVTVWVSPNCYLVHMLFVCTGASQPTITVLNERLPTPPIRHLTSTSQSNRFITMKKLYMDILTSNLVENVISCGECDVLWRMWYLVENVISCGECDIWWRMWYLVEKVISGGECDIWWRMWYLVENVISCGECDILWRMWYLVENVIYCGECDIL